MKALLEIHALQNFAPSNLNRDDTGSPKDCEFGGYRRARISSQSLKRAMRTYIDTESLLDENELAVRTKRVTTELAKQLAQLDERKEASEEDMAVVEMALSGLSLSVDEGKTQYLLYLGKQEIKSMAQAIYDVYEGLKELVAREAGEKESKKKTKKDAKTLLQQDFKNMITALEKSLDGGKAVDLALFGRMLADLPEKNRDAACQVAHAISTNAVQREFDFYTAVDDLKPDDNAGADMLGTVEFNSACYYRYIALDLEKLAANLQGDGELLEKGLRAFLEASYFAAPSGKQNSFAAHNPPGFFAVSVRSDAAPRNLANAFEKPVRPDREHSLTEASVARLDEQWAAFDKALGVGDANEVAVLKLTGDLAHLAANVRESLEDVVTSSVAAAKRAVGA